MNQKTKKLLILITVAALCCSAVLLKDVFRRAWPYIEMAMLTPEKRMRIARREKDAQIRKLFADAGIEYPPREIFLRTFKNMHGGLRNPRIELWVRASAGGKFKLLKTYPVCSASGTFGPKRREGDNQVPEGFYEVSEFNPRSRHFFALKVSYPNESDAVLSSKTKPGTNIFIHGGCTSVGCMAITDNSVKELYLIAFDTKHNGGKPIKLHIFPAEMTAENMKMLASTSESHRQFWLNLKEGYDLFEKTHIPPDTAVDERGSYSFH